MCPCVVGGASGPAGFSPSCLGTEGGRFAWSGLAGSEGFALNKTAHSSASSLPASFANPDQQHVAVLA